MTSAISWRFLVVDDSQAESVEKFIVESSVVTHPDTVVIEKCTDFEQAITLLEKLRIDLVILDVKDDSINLPDGTSKEAGERVFDQIRDARFVPVIFHTAYAHKVANLEGPFVRIVSRDQPRRLLQAISDIFSSGLPRLVRHLESQQREYMWEHVQNKWSEDTSEYTRADLTYLLGRRLANTLERRAIRRFLIDSGITGLADSDEKIHPVEMYVYPPTNPKLLAGDIIKSSYSDHDGYWLILTPSCDLVQQKAENVILAPCLPLEDQPEYKMVEELTHEKVTATPKQREKIRERLVRLLKNDRNGFDGNRFQPDRYSYLPGTFFLPDLVVDFQALVRVSVECLKLEDRIASLDSPFAEACLARFTRYYGRLGTPDLDYAYALERVLASIAASQGEPAA